MSEFEAIIVAVTHMHEGRCCVGALQVERVGRLDEPLAQSLDAILTRNSNIPLVRGGVDLLFEGKLLHDTQNARDGWSRYILPGNSPVHSTSFGIPNFSLRVEIQFNKLRAFSREAEIGLSYVAVEPRIQAGSVIPSGSLLRVSLARPWSPDADTPPKSYMMLSQYYEAL